MSSCGQRHRKEVSTTKQKEDESEAGYIGWQSFFDAHAYKATMEVENRYYAMGSDSCVLAFYDSQLRALQESVDGVTDDDKFANGVLKELEDLGFEVSKDDKDDAKREGNGGAAMAITVQTVAVEANHQETVDATGKRTTQQPPLRPAAKRSRPLSSMLAICHSKPRRRTYTTTFRRFMVKITFWSVTFLLKETQDDLAGLGLLPCRKLLL